MQVLDKVPPEIWKALTTFFIDYPENSQFHQLYYKIFVDIVHSHHEPLLKVHIIRLLFPQTKQVATGVLLQGQVSYQDDHTIREHDFGFVSKLMGACSNA